MRQAITGALIALGLLWLASCATVVDKPRVVTVNVPVAAPLPAELTQDCAPAPLVGTTVGAALDRLASVEGALKDCRERMAALRQIGK